MDRHPRVHTFNWTKLHERGKFVCAHVSFFLQKFGHVAHTHTLEIHAKSQHPRTKTVAAKEWGKLLVTDKKLYTPIVCCLLCVKHEADTAAN